MFKYVYLLIFQLFPFFMIYSNISSMTIRQLYPSDNSIYYTENKEMIDLYYSFLKENKPVSHRCGYDWIIEFWENDMVLYQLRYNIKCLDFKNNKTIIYNEIVNFLKNIRNNLSHSVYHLKVNSFIDPERLKNDFKLKNQNIFFMDWEYNHLPRVEIILSNSIIKTFDDNTGMEELNPKNKKIISKNLEFFIQSELKDYSIVFISKLLFKETSSSKIEYKITVSTLIYFDRNVNLDKIKKMNPHQYNIDSIEVTVPEFYYFQFITAENDLEKVEILIHSHFNYIISIDPYSTALQ